MNELDKVIIINQGWTAYSDGGRLHTDLIFSSCLFKQYHVESKPSVLVYPLNSCQAVVGNGKPPYIHFQPSSNASYWILYNSFIKSSFMCIRPHLDRALFAGCKMWGKSHWPFCWSLHNKKEQPAASFLLLLGSHQNTVLTLTATSLHIYINIHHLHLYKKWTGRGHLLWHWLRVRDCSQICLRQRKGDPLGTWDPQNEDRAQGGHRLVEQFRLNDGRFKVYFRMSQDYAQGSLKICSQLSGLSIS